ncbi:MAG: class I SAM-dependent methyltransferase [Propionivibrio sp.]
MHKQLHTIDLPFSAKYDQTHSEQYLRKHNAGLARRLSHLRDTQLARKALRQAGDPRHVLDLPCGAGRFWPVLLENAGRTLVAADNSAAMLDVAARAHPEAVRRGVRLLRTSAFAIDLPDQSTDCIFSMRLMHHIGRSADRMAMLREFQRVTRDTVILSLWVDGNFKAWRRHRLEEQRQRAGNKYEQNRFVIPAHQIEREFADSGFVVRASNDFLPGYAMWRVYVLAKHRP